MRHALRYEGGFERNFSKLRPGTTEYEGDDGAAQHAAPWPASADGIRIGFMEQQGKRFFAVRVCYGDREVLLQHPVRIDPARHMGSVRFSAEPIAIDDSSASQLLGDIMDHNPEQREELGAVRDAIRQAMGPGRRR